MIYKNLFQETNKTFVKFTKWLGFILIWLSIFAIGTQIYEYYAETNIFKVRIKHTKKIELDRELDLGIYINDESYISLYSYDLQFFIKSDSTMFKEQKAEVYIDFSGSKVLKLITKDTESNSVAKLVGGRLKVKISSLLHNETYKFKLIIDKPTLDVTVDGEVQGAETKVTFGFLTKSSIRSYTEPNKFLNPSVYFFILLISFMVIAYIYDRLLLKFKLRRHRTLLRLNLLEFPDYKSRFLFKEFLIREFNYLDKETDMKNLMDFVDSLDNDSDDFLQQHKSKIKIKIENILLRLSLSNEPLVIAFFVLFIVFALLVAVILRLI